jgi:hypothetical protein
VRNSVAVTLGEAQRIVPGDAFASNFAVLADVRLDVSAKIWHATVVLLVRAAWERTSEVGFFALIAAE